MTAAEEYIKARDERIREYQKDKSMEVAVKGFTEHLVRANYVKNWSWLGVPTIQYPMDLMVLQDIIWKVRPDYIIETGIAFGGSLLFYASVLEAIGKKGKVLGIDIDPREENMAILEKYILSYRISVVKGSSTDTRIVEATKDYCSDGVTMVILDSNHVHSHVLQELQLYSPMVSVGSFIIVMDTAIEFYSHLDKNQDRDWHPGNSPWTAVQAFLKTDMGKNFVIDKEIEQRILITSAIDGWLRRIK